ncbi:class I SAM-dependent methyltransferase [Sphingomonas ginsenosidivorax]|uniref:Class I SAM-dependent methyltransferase n=1 Tax=Sphingomonas ginsenosidivorax TaxID=862135 RepID=A0A5C6UGS3_9SPHN|nr:class I SAM-dependent methyltransferase [Sphingomonas ginsenosidivorax]TXC71992.1 class I SAM-dependent methyltransferase [Sphingomonas ginsenosidivorax]
MTAVSEIYSRGYCDTYAALYIDPWPAKHAANLRILDFLLDRGPQTRWLDLACGQAWHFAHLAGRAQMTGVDASASQLAKARIAAPHATFVCDDLRTFEPTPDAFDLITVFWGAYCYLADWSQIATLLTKAVSALRPDGSIYIEVLPIEAIDTFDSSSFAKTTGFRSRRAGQSNHWIYRDTGGLHRMMSPPTRCFEALFEGRFHHVRVHDDGCFMQHLVAYRRLACGRPAQADPPG